MNVTRTTATRALMYLRLIIGGVIPATNECHASRAVLLVMDIAKSAASIAAPLVETIHAPLATVNTAPAI